jgi:predicted DNA-binding protein
MAERQRTEISAELLESLRRKAEDQGRTEADVLDEAVRRYLERSGSLDELLRRIEQGRRDRGVESLSEDEAMRLAVEEQHAWRRERAG